MSLDCVPSTKCVVSIPALVIRVFIHNYEKWAERLNSFTLGITVAPTFGSAYKIRPVSSCCPFVYGSDRREDTQFWLAQNHDLAGLLLQPAPIFVDILFCNANSISKSDSYWNHVVGS